MRASKVFAAPLRFGAGIQNKLLEAMAMEVPVVASGLAADGLRTADGDVPPLEIADGPEAFAGIEMLMERAKVVVEPAAGCTLAAARRLRAIVKQNLAIAVLYNLVAVTLCLFGLVTPVVAAVLMPLAFVVGAGWGVTGLALAWLAMYPVEKTIALSLPMKSAMISSS